MPIGSPKEFIETVLPDKLSDPKKLEGLGFALQFDIAGDNGGQWVLEVRDSKASVKSGVVDKPNITIKMKDINFVKLVNGELSGQKAFMTGKLKFKGEMTTALKLQKLGII